MINPTLEGPTQSVGEFSVLCTYLVPQRREWIGEVSFVS